MLNSFLQRIEQDASHSLILAATNHGQFQDPACCGASATCCTTSFRVRSRSRPCSGRASATSLVKGVGWQRLARLATGLSHAEVSRAGDEALEEALIAERMPLREADLRATLQERQHAASRLARKG